MKCRDFANKLKGMLSSPPMEEMLTLVGATVKARTIHRFLGEIDPYGRDWKQLSSRTLDARYKSGRGAMILRDRGYLYRSLNFRVDINDDQVVIGFGMEYAPIHQFGAGKIPARPMLDLKSEDTIEDKLINAVILDVLDEYFVDI